MALGLCFLYKKSQFFTCFLQDCVKYQRSYQEKTHYGLGHLQKATNALRNFVLLFFYMKISKMQCTYFLYFYFICVADPEFKIKYASSHALLSTPFSGVNMAHF